MRDSRAIGLAVGIFREGGQLVETVELPPFYAAGTVWSIARLSLESHLGRMAAAVANGHPLGEMTIASDASGLVGRIDGNACYYAREVRR